MRAPKLLHHGIRSHARERLCAVVAPCLNHGPARPRTVYMLVHGWQYIYTVHAIYMAHIHIHVEQLHMVVHMYIRYRNQHYP